MMRRISMFLIVDTCIVSCASNSIELYWLCPNHTDWMQWFGVNNNYLSVIINMLVYGISD
jgi:hypothetical protein